MPVEIRELKIQTKIVSQAETQGLSAKDLHLLKQQMLQECLKSLKLKTRKSPFER